MKICMGEHTERERWYLNQGRTWFFERMAHVSTLPWTSQCHLFTHLLVSSGFRHSSGHLGATAAARYKQMRQQECLEGTCGQGRGWRYDVCVNI